jgi:hypothetical protein
MNRRVVKICFPLVLVAIALVTRNWDAFSRYQDVDLKAMGNFPLSAEAGTLNDVPARFRALDGRRVRMVGFILDSSGNGHPTRFQFSSNPTGQSWHSPPRVQERVFATMPPGKTADFVGGLAELSGTLHVKVKYDSSGVIASVYELDVEQSAPPGMGPQWPGWIFTLVVIVFAVWGFRAALAMLRRYPRRRPTEVCPVCGYDLRATRGAARNAVRFRPTPWQNPRRLLHAPDSAGAVVGARPDPGRRGGGIVRFIEPTSRRFAPA